MNEKHAPWRELSNNQFDLANETSAPPLAVQVGEITKEETAEAIRALKNSKVAGLDEITGEMLKYGGEDMVAKLTGC